MIGVGVDITDSKKAEESLQESDAKYLLLLNSSAEAIYGLDLQGNCTFCNAACVKLLGHSAPEDLHGKNMDALMHHTQPDGSFYKQQECGIYLLCAKASLVTLPMKCCGVPTAPASLLSTGLIPCTKAGDLVGAVVTFLDISDRKRAEKAQQDSEEKYRKLFENATYGIFRSTPDGTLLDADPALVTMLGYGSREELLTRNLSADIYEDPAVRKSILDRHSASGSVLGCHDPAPTALGHWDFFHRRNGGQSFATASEASLYRTLECINFEIALPARNQAAVSRDSRRKLRPRFSRPKIRTSERAAITISSNAVSAQA